LSSISQEEQAINKDSVSLNSYEEMAEYYFKYVDIKPFNAYYERPATISLLPQVRGKKVLDAGCAVYDILKVPQILIENSSRRNI